MSFRLKINPNSYFARLTLLKKIFWLYFLLLIFEGALRKWILPRYSAPLLVVRDPVALWIIWEAYRTRKWPTRWSVAIAMVTLLIIGIFSLQIATGNNQLLVGLYGLRSYLLPFPVIFIMGENLNREDLRKLGECTLWLLLPMCALAIAQYLAPGGSILNTGAYHGGAQIGYVGARVRASGTFSFAIGLVEFATLAGAFVFDGMIQKDFVKNWLLWAGAIALILIVPTTGQRSLVVQLAAVVLCVAASAMMGISQFAKLLRVAGPITILLLLVSLLPVFKRSMQSLNDRFAQGAALEGGTFQATMYTRTIEPLVNAVDSASSTNDGMGIGLGRGALAVQAFLTGRARAVTGEYEFSHEFMEMGPFAGGLFEFFKALLLVAIFGQAFARAREHEPLALLLFPLVFATMTFGLLEEPTVQGFVVISTAFCIAAAKEPALAAVQLPSLMRQRQQSFQRRRIQRG